MFHFFIFSVLVSLFVTTKAYQRCNTASENWDRVCYDTYNTWGYCCDYEDDHYTDCCYSLKVWAMWYFWIGMVALFALLATAVAGCLRHLKRRGNKSSRSSSISNSEAGVVVMTQSAPYNEQIALQTKLADSPPSYQDLQAQGLAAQQVAVSSYQTPQASAAVLQSASEHDQ
ncbi:unnamed protein product [Clavelina lepadiformis]|uniref:Uncharacterized protein n=1 Tax=Clavelina lepadiformis TaxID=159417 RepID=A0ABP0EYD8_CLALP